MTDAQFCLEWDSHNRNICSGLSSLQQNGEFVDMTLAADGHHVKVHQMVLALASPYIKELISSANCPHPVIFLNKVSYKTLCSILEYIYTGQAMVAVEEINELIVAAKELHIKGLEDVKSVGGVPSVSDTEQQSSFPEEQPSDSTDIQIKLQRQNPVAPTPVVERLSALKRRLASSEKTPSNVPLRKRTFPPNTSDSGTTKDMPIVKDDGGETDKSFGYDDPLDDDNHDDGEDYCIEDTTPVKKISTPGQPDNAPMSVQYTLSNQGSLQLILNRFVYSLYYQYRDKSRQWRCIDNRTSKCVASVFTKDNMVLRRVGAHTHPFHDRNILKKVRAGAVFSALQEAEAKSTKTPRKYLECSIQYTISNQGAVQLILNRYIYSLNYRYRDNRRQWKCVDGRDYKCPAKVVTKDNMVIRRISAHTHAFHDHKILKKVMASCVYSAIQEAEAFTSKKKENEKETKDETV